MFGLILITATALMQVYVFWRASSVPFVNRHIPRILFIGLGVLLWVLFFLSRTIGRNGTGPAAAVLEFIGMNWVGILFLTFSSLLLVDLITLFGLLMPRFAPALRGWALITGGVLSAIALFQGMRPPVIQSYEVQVTGLPAERDGTVLVALSDLHIDQRSGSKWLAARIAQIERERPELVVLLGDIFEGRDQPSEELVKNFNRLSAPSGVWAVMGNHEYFGDLGSITALMEKAGFQLLRNRSVEVFPGLVLAGVEDLTHASRIGRKDYDISHALAGRPPGATILLSHTPWKAEDVAKAGVGLMLSGHTHGGQIWPFDYLLRTQYPLLEGRYEVNGMTVIVCRGTGEWGPRMRLWNPGEILRITLRKK